MSGTLSLRLRRAQRAESYESRSDNVPDIDYGQGRFAAAQREVLEVLLNEPKLYETVKQKITADIFDVPILGQVAAVLFKTLDKNIDTPLNEILARAESVELGNCIMELATVGQKKGNKCNFKSTLAGALNAIEQYKAQQRNTGIRAIEDGTEYLRKRHRNTGKKRDIVGMV